MTTTRQSEIYAVHVKTICQWKNDGIKAGIEAPLDHPDQMPGWWERMKSAGKFQKSCPPSLLRAAGLVGVGSADGFGEQDDGDPADLSGGNRMRDYAASVQLAERNLNAVQAMFDKAVKDGNDALIVALQKPLNDALDSHRALMRDRGKIQAEAGETLPKAEVRAAMLELFANVQKQFRQGIKAAFAATEDVTASREEWGIFADELVDRICKKLTDSDFAAD